MARQLEFKIGNETVGLELIKIERSKLYGSSLTLAFDENGEKCELMSLANDGKTLFGEGGSAIQTMTLDGEVIEKSELTPVDADGKPLPKIESSFNSPIEVLEKAEVEEYLSATVKSVYGFSKSAGQDSLVELLKDGAIYKFDFSYRGGHLADKCFLLLNQDGTPFMIVTNPADFALVGFEDSVGLEEDSSEELSVDELDFDMM